eukprot:CAMPEP_0204912620 /NCGR_PEP_ID=MMETSP1397-20131031/10735_1 /ASSEMBLY_ACC=CAM_ASM_000891 /TAXON_ID=49980 /ORGANISM="Climacostomum Climacostomum virens, Strain Stock W-24" /LENGTH=78 /DNA_ID=CAMNT_0052083635 /DNA_START=265 /DNA_END=501 /DNA_ORIENTATION=+
MAIIFNTNFAEMLGSVNANAVRYSLLAACVTLLVSFLLGWWYRNSMMISRYYYEHSAMGLQINDASPLYQELSAKYKR